MALPTTLKRRLIDNLYRTTAKAAASLPAGTTGDLFTIAGGKVEISVLVGEVVTIIETQDCNTKLIANPTTGTSTDLCTIRNISADEIGAIWGLNLSTPFGGSPFSNAFATYNSGANLGLATTLVVGIGAIELSTSATNTGTVKWTCFWRPIDDGAAITAA